MPKDEGPDESTFSKRFARLLFERYRHWEQLWVPPNLDWQSNEDIAVEVPSRFAPHCPLRVETMADGIIVSWAGWHDHCDDWGGDYNEDEFVAEALELISDIISERRVIVTAWSEGKVHSSGNSLLSELEKDLQTAWTVYHKGQDIVILSWNGTYDRGHFDPTKC